MLSIRDDVSMHVFMQEADSSHFRAVLSMFAKYIHEQMTDHRMFHTAEALHGVS